MGNPLKFDIIDYFLAGGLAGGPEYGKVVGYDKTTPTSCQFRYNSWDNENVYVINQRFNQSWNFSLYNYRWKRRAIESIYDCFDYASNQSCMNRYTVFADVTRKEYSIWLKTLTELNKVTTYPRAWAFYWQELSKLPCGDQMGISMPYAQTLAGMGTFNFGGDAGTRPFIAIDHHHLDGSNTTERIWYALNWGPIAGNQYDHTTGSYTGNISYMNYFVDIPKTLPDLNSVRPVSFRPPGPYLSVIQKSSVRISRMYPEKYETFGLIHENTGNWLISWQDTPKQNDKETNKTARQVETYYLDIDIKREANLGDTKHIDDSKRVIFERQPTGYYAIRAKKSGLLLRANNGSKDSFITQNQTVMDNADLFGVVDLGNNTYNIFTADFARYGPEFQNAGIPPLATL